MKSRTSISRSTAGSSLSVLFAIVLGLVSPAAHAQAVPQGGTAPTEPRLASPVLTLDQDAMFSGSAFGQRVQQALQRDRAVLARENRRIEAELVEEELELTRLRETTPPDEFAAMADAFDRKVQEVRDTQDGKSIQLQQRLDRERQAFLTEAGPVIAALVRQRGAFVVLDRSVILLSFDGVDITQEAIAAIDEAIGAGGDGKLPPPAPLRRERDPDGALPATPR